MNVGSQINGFGNIGYFFLSVSVFFPLSGLEMDNHFRTSGHSFREVD